ncbi:MAG: DUF2780 domain-containing protein [Hoeflea sp.]|uniref:DUF2267 domain-containing protein n=1 Tax=Hoeflea sp. TaxID=1940281 RepID=UPI001DB4A43A|nr:DUF2267 domain-containing protein [Hoeflea sp.]MBU4527912.1 DUF2780 domain-containing protein [Alphaproteobacteria bacterium]MBU4546053.1 DUF2780 domain-containing protein [Alphaproteobacteria bacterium]MBU4553262.1 DUF2780 domain-containing protein [Alphaproteobacteria bacterium]MBV1724336.1 DUF2780 domain-containing protein [Hoeflea sp.]MBV1763332.1 DUF2780 domain-containing protein [Hoeflea sp.]
MDELINRITANVGIDADTAKKAVGAILAFLQSEGPADKVKELLASVPGSEELIAQAPAGGMLSMGGVMGLGQKLMGLGLGMGEISGVSKQTMGYARENGAGNAVDEIVASIPGLSQFV